MSRRRRVLIVEDDDSIREFLEMALSEGGYDVASAVDGATGLETASRFMPHLVLLDLRMSGMDGWRFADVYRDAPEPRGKVLVITASSDAAGSAAQLAADGYLAKPFELAELLRLVGRLAG